MQHADAQMTMAGRLYLSVYDCKRVSDSWMFVCWSITSVRTEGCAYCCYTMIMHIKCVVAHNHYYR